MICIRTGICHVAKFKTRQIVLGTDSPNLMLAKVSRYTVRTTHVILCKNLRLPFEKLHIPRPYHKLGKFEHIDVLHSSVNTSKYVLHY